MVVVTIVVKLRFYGVSSVVVVVVVVEVVLILFSDLIRRIDSG